jgi:hypothetical protein
MTALNDHWPKLRRRLNVRSQVLRCAPPAIKDAGVAGAPGL